MTTRESVYVLGKRFRFAETDPEECEAGREFRIVSDSELDWLETRVVMKLPGGQVWATGWQRMKPA